jgi:Tfp pilus assembly protein PilZ
MTTRLDVRRTVLLPLKNAAAFFDVYFEQGALGGITVPLDAGLALGEEVDIEITFATESIVFQTRGVARWRRVAVQRNLPAGIGVEFKPSERRTRDLLLNFARGQATAVIKRAARRFPVVMPVEWSYSDQVRTDVTDNVSKSGVFIRTTTLPAIGERIAMKLKPPVFRFGIDVEGEVMWRQESERTGVGLKFINVSKGTQKKLDELIDKIKEQMASDRGAA